MKKTLKIISPIIIIIGLFLIFREKEISHPPGILVSNQPYQKKLAKRTYWEKEDYKFEGVANFKGQFRVLSIRFYGSDDMSDFCPVDLAVGWGPMSDQSVIDKIDIKQQHRWYVWQADFFPIPQKDIETHSSNIHIIPASEIVEDRLDEVIKGNIISLNGVLVNVNKIGEKFKYKTSLKRDDTGGGACEIFWVEDIQIIK